MKEGFTIKDIVEAVGVTRERFKEWVSRGYIEPSIQRSKKQGTANIYSRIDVYRIAIFDSLLKHGFKRDSAANFIKHYEKIDETKYPVFSYEIFQGKQLITPVDIESIVDGIKTGVVFSDGGHRVWNHLHIINFEKLRMEVDAKLNKL